MRVNADSLLIRAATTSTSGTLNDLTTDLIMANNIRRKLSQILEIINSEKSRDTSNRRKYVIIFDT